ncbi:hypothetical protein TNCV_531971 [Trichonephila clavipes]|nr:hypothetical protein TNCV_531971 [Trichonephila clavipes]
MAKPCHYPFLTVGSSGHGRSISGRQRKDSPNSKNKLFPAHKCLLPFHPYPLTLTENSLKIKIKDIIKMGRTNLLERRQNESVGRRADRTTFLRSDWPRPFARREVGVETDWVDRK